MRMNNCDCGDQVPSEFYQIERNITAINNNPPYPDPNGSGYWMIYNPSKRKYELSDVKVPVYTGDIGVVAYAATSPALKASSVVCTWTIAHNLNKKVAYHMTEVSSKEDVIPTVVVLDDNILTIKIASNANIAAGTYQVTIVGVSQ